MLDTLILNPSRRNELPTNHGGPAQTELAFPKSITQVHGRDNYQRYTSAANVWSLARPDLTHDQHGPLPLFTRCQDRILRLFEAQKLAENRQNGLARGVLRSLLFFNSHEG